MPVFPPASLDEFYKENPKSQIPKFGLPKIPCAGYSNDLLTLEKDVLVPAPTTAN